MKSYFIPFCLLLLVSACSPSSALIGEESDKQWYKGNLHTHSFWSDGDDFPEMIMQWYRDHDYQFVGLSDHNTLQEGEKWTKVSNNLLREETFQKYQKAFESDWVESKTDTAGTFVKLKTLDEYRSRFEKEEEFLILKSEEITDSYDGKPVHMNATNIKSRIEPRHGNSMVEVLQNNINAVLEQREATGQPMFPHINHPNFGWAMTAEDLKQLKGERFFEVYNGHPAVHNYGDSARLGTEAMWDIINHHYLKNDQELMLGLATDDSHNYHTFGPQYSNTGRGWVMVSSEELSPEALIRNLEAGNFYASTGVSLIKFGLRQNEYIVEVSPEPNVQYQIQIMVWLEGDEQATLMEPVSANKNTYQLSGRELFIRAKITSDRLQENPFQAGDYESAWTQPVIIN